jgi:hypothetical protein
MEVAKVEERPLLFARMQLCRSEQEREVDLALNHERVEKVVSLRRPA